MTCATAICLAPGGSTALLQSHLGAILAAIVRTRQEIAGLRHEQEASRACDELHAVVQGTEQGTDTILSASETVDALARCIGQRARDETTRTEAQAIQDRMQAIFEACNFQDLTGQRISKVVRTIVFVEERIGKAPMAAAKAYGILKDMTVRLDQDLVDAFHPVTAVTPRFPRGA